MNDDFSIGGYHSLLNVVQTRGFNIRPVCEAFAGDGLVMLLRHDVDLSLSLALQMAQLEAERGIVATYYILPHNDYYNPLSPKGRRELARIAELGHEIGLHCDGVLYPSERGLFKEAIRRDIAVIEDITGRPVRSASQHSPIDSKPLNLSALVSVDPYSPKVMKSYAYASDSNMSWRTRPSDLIERGANFQLLIHPIWWMTEGRTRSEKFELLKAESVGSIVQKLDETLAYLERCLAERSMLDARHDQRRDAMVTPRP